MLFSSNLPRLLDPQVRKVWDQSSASVPNQVMSKIYVEGETELQTTKDASISGLAMAGEVSEGANIPLQDVLAGPTTTYIQRRFGTGFEVTAEMIKFDLFSQIVKLPQAAAQALVRKVEFDAASLLFRGWTDTTGADAQPLFSASHTIAAGGTQSNIIVSGGTTNPALAVDALDAAQVMMAKTKDEKGELAPTMPTKLIVGPGIWATADVILGTMRKPAGSNNDVNRWYNSLELVVAPYINANSTGASAYADTMWVLVDDTINPFVWLWAQKPKLYDGELNYDKKSVKYNADAFYDLGHSDYRGVMGSQGDNS